ncbi:hypothetical protein BD309DRAFT_726475 [Dichomitus squalens]|uniref:Uncharacterized protein n=1 Tax=Dichomitus squalens TaxID=114155 RepID=A0A4Q9P051_9APHY|nr:hypothetical protein BD309DRAFT_726475 [Dichomitus squalens]TBU60217.1 hypothetical protein BD310DRAFT_923050 [Dichomitus squalens]
MCETKRLLTVDSFLLPRPEYPRTQLTCASLLCALTDTMNVFLASFLFLLACRRLRLSCLHLCSWGDVPEPRFQQQQR